uniref:Thrombomodulin n=1 Tax=Gadus morhua TaxID=8049 RepID=A0A8C5FWE3_GADMO
MKEVLFCVARLLVLLSLLAARLAHGGRPPLAYLEDCDDNTCFLLFPGAHDFAGARDACLAEGGILATLPSAAEARRVQELLLRAGIGRFWIGLTLAEGRCPTNDSANYGYEWVTEAAAGISSNWTGVPDRCDRKCVSVSTDGAWQQESCEGTLDGFLCSAPFGWCPLRVKRFQRTRGKTPGGTLWMTRGEKGSRYFDSKWLCGHGKWWRAPWFCEVETGGCSHTCVNSMCTCPDGLKLHSNNVTCVDERECSDTADCTGEHVQCRERLEGGGSECSCMDGYAMEDGACMDVKICELCEHMLCPTVEGAKVCTCRSGFVVSQENATRCDPHCDRPDCPAHCVVDTKGRSHGEDPAVCAPFRGGDSCRALGCAHGCGGAPPACACRPGFLLGGDGRSYDCVDVDECQDAPCEHQCTNTRGSFTCSCFDGYRQDPGFPQRCQAYCGLAECPAECDPNDPEDCRCPMGYILDVRKEGGVCMDLDECNNYYCDQLCKNSYGNYTCSCLPGFSLVEGHECVLGTVTESFTLSYVPTSDPAPPKTARLSAGGLVAVVVAVAVVVFLAMILVYHFATRRSEGRAASPGGAGAHSLEQVASGLIEKAPALGE